MTRWPPVINSNSQAIAAGTPNGSTKVKRQAEAPLPELADNGPFRQAAERLTVRRAARRSARPRHAERPAATGNPPPFLSLRALPGSTGRLLQLAEPPHPRRVTLRGGEKQRIRDDLAVRSPDSSREILRALGVDQQLRTSAPCRTVRLPRHVPDLPARELPLKLAPTLTVSHGLSPSSTLSNTPIPGHEYPRQPRCASCRPCQSTTPRHPQLTRACSREPTRTRQALRRAAPEASDLFSGTAAALVPDTGYARAQ
jgi:hypothetical protein